MAEEKPEEQESEEGAEGTDETDGVVSDKDGVDGAIEDAGEKTYTQEQFSGLLRDKQTSDTTRQQAQAEAATLKQANEQLQRDLEGAKKPKETELSEEDAAEEVTQGQLVTFGKNLVKNITEAISTQRDTDKAATLKQRQAQDAQGLIKTHNVKTMGQGLDATTVINEGALYLQTNHPTLFKAAMESENSASELYKLCTTFVPDIVKKVAAKNNTELATKLDESGETPPSGQTPPTTEAEGLLEGILAGSVSEADLDKMVLEAQG